MAIGWTAIALFTQRASESTVTREDARISSFGSPEFVWKVSKDIGRGSEMFPTWIKAETLAGGSVEDAGSVHTCLHGDGMHLVHYRVAVDEENYRATDRLSGVPVVDRMLQTWEVAPSGSGSRFRFYYSMKPWASIPDEDGRRVVEETVRAHAEQDVLGFKAFCEAEYTAR